MIIKVPHDGREYWHFPVTGTDEAPQLQVDGEWVTLDAAPSYAPDPVVEGAIWWRVLLAGPDCTGNPSGTVVITVPMKLRVRLVDGFEILPEFQGWAIPE